MPGTTNRIPFDEAADLVGSARACVAWSHGDRPHVEPAIVVDEHGRFLVGIDGDAPGAAVDEVVLLVDEGVLFFDLRAVLVRGRPVWAAAPSADGRAWFEIEPGRVTCWDYGRLRIDDGHD